MTQSSIWLLSTVPGLPPILQTVHLLGLAVLMASIVMICLRLLGGACRRQQVAELLPRLFPWFFWALPVMLISGLPFLLARPQRYLGNPVFMIKAALLVLALAFSLIIWHRFRRRPCDMQKVTTRMLAAVTLISWVMTAMAGRWVAYADYLFWPG